MSKTAKRAAMLKKHIKIIAKKQPLSKLTPKQLRRKLEQSLKLRNGKLDKMKAEVLEIALRLVPMPSDGAILDIKVVSLKKQIGKRKRAAVKAGAVIDVAATGMSEKRAKLSKNGNRPPSAAKKAFRSFIRAARVSPSIFKGLSELGDSAQIEALRDRLSQKGFKFKGKYPNITEIKEAQQKKEQDDNLDGIDTSAILSPSRKRGGREASHKYERKSSAKGREDEDESEEEEFSL